MVSSLILLLLLRDALTDDTLIKVCNQAIKTNLAAKLKKGLQVTIYNFADMKDSSNFFNLVSQWETIVLSIETHLKMYYMETPFTLYTSRETCPNDDLIWSYDFALGEFLGESALHGGDSEFYTDGEDRFCHPTAPTGTVLITSGGDTIHNWHTMTLAQVCNSIKLWLMGFSSLALYCIINQTNQTNVTRRS